VAAAGLLMLLHGGRRALSTVVTAQQLFKPLWQIHRSFLLAEKVPLKAIQDQFEKPTTPVKDSFKLQQSRLRWCRVEPFLVQVGPAWSGPRDGV